MTIIFFSSLFFLEKNFVVLQIVALYTQSFM